MSAEIAQLLQMSGTALPEELSAGMLERAERKVRAAILLGELGRREGVTVAREDLDKRYAEIAERTGKHVAKVKVEWGTGERRETLENQIFEEKLMTILLGKATIVDAEPEKKEEAP